MVNCLGIDTAMMDHQPRNHRRLVCDIVRMLGAHQSVLLVMNKRGVRMTRTVIFANAGTFGTRQRSVDALAGVVAGTPQCY